MHANKYQCGGREAVRKALIAVTVHGPNHATKRRGSLGTKRNFKMEIKELSSSLYVAKAMPPSIA